MRQQKPFSAALLAELRQQTPFLAVQAWDLEYAVRKINGVVAKAGYKPKILTGSLDEEDRETLLTLARTTRLFCMFVGLSESYAGWESSSRRGSLFYNTISGLRELLFQVWRQRLPLTVAIVDRVVELPASLQIERPVMLRLDRPEVGDVELALQRYPDALQVWKRFSRSDQQLLTEALFSHASYRAGAHMLARWLTQFDTIEEVLLAVQKNRSGAFLMNRTLQQVEIDPEEVTIGGMPGLRQWLWEVEGAFTEEGRAFGLQPPRGVLLVGVPGTGKSLAAKLAAHAWNLPLVRLDLPAVFGPYIGESEAYMRETLASLEAFGPAVVLLDELDKLFVKETSSTGTQERVRAYLLTWMQERREGSVIFATANDLTMVPPELVRRGRIDEVFFVDLPTFSERKEIWEVMLNRHVFRHQAQRRPIYARWKVTPPSPEDFDLDKLAAHTEGFTGAEIEEAVRKALYQSFALRQAMAMRHLTGALEEIIPQAYTQVEQIHKLRRLVREGRVRSVSPSDEEPVRIPYYGSEV
ncbi:MAG: hypothetical protein KatS3mg026_1685 [Bacteroidia bacterium]|nr:MAG: hypothetical protein KatS3mg026_1685 [Bacteroidia bacterium]